MPKTAPPLLTFRQHRAQYGGHLEPHVGHPVVGQVEEVGQQLLAELGVGHRVDQGAAHDPVRLPPDPVGRVGQLLREVGHDRPGQGGVVGRGAEVPDQGGEHARRGVPDCRHFVLQRRGV